MSEAVVGPPSAGSGAALAKRPSVLKGTGVVVLDFEPIINLLKNMTEETARTIPTPTGYRVLVAMPSVKQKTAGGIDLPATMTAREETATVACIVVDLGTDTYKDTRKFPSGPYCKPGDIVMIRAYSGTRFKIGDIEFRYVNDDSIEGVVEDPSEIQRL